MDSIQDRGVWEMPIEKDLRGKITVIRPWVYTSTRLCRGMHFIGEGKMELENGTIIQSMITPTDHSIPLFQIDSILLQIIDLLFHKND